MTSPYLALEFLVCEGHSSFWSFSNIFGVRRVSEGTFQSRTAPLDAAKYSIYYTLYLQNTYLGWKRNLSIKHGEKSRIGTETSVKCILMFFMTIFRFFFIFFISYLFSFTVLFWCCQMLFSFNFLSPLWHGEERLEVEKRGECQLDTYLHTNENLSLLWTRGLCWVAQTSAILPSIIMSVHLYTNGCMGIH